MLVMSPRAMSRQQLLTTIHSMLIPPILLKALLFTIRFHGIARTPPTKRGRRGGKSAQASYSWAKQFLHCSLVNARSLLSRSHIVQHHIIENNLDFVAITESWLPVESGDEILRGTCPAGYSGLHVPRTGRRSGGVAVNEERIRFVFCPKLLIILFKKRSVLHFLYITEKWCISSLVKVIDLNVNLIDTVKIRWCIGYHVQLSCQLTMGQIHDYCKFVCSHFLGFTKRFFSFEINMKNKT